MSCFFGHFVQDEALSFYRGSANRGIKNRLNVLDVVGSYGNSQNRNKSQGVCPFTQKGPSFFVSPPGKCGTVLDAAQEAIFSNYIKRIKELSFRGIAYLSSKSWGRVKTL
jgi:hypothetical protein